MKKFLLGTAVILSATAISSQASAQILDDLSVSVSTDYVSEYVFRGVALLMQPFSLVLNCHQAVFHSVHGIPRLLAERLLARSMNSIFMAAMVGTLATLSPPVLVSQSSTSRRRGNCLTVCFQVMEAAPLKYMVALA